MKWGHCKEGFHNHVVLALLVNREGLPFYWEVLPGNTADTKTLTWLLDQVKIRFKVTQTTLIFDRGMVSDDNLTSLEQAKIKYISAQDKDQREGITRFDLTQFSHFREEKIHQQVSSMKEFIKLDDNTWYREVMTKGERRYILGFNSELFKETRKARQKAVATFRVYVDNLNEQLRMAKRTRQNKPTYEKFKRQLIKTKLNTFVDVKLSLLHIKLKAQEETIRTSQASVQVDEKAMLRAGKLDGFWLLVTNHAEKSGSVFKINPSYIITSYRDKVVIESSFRDLKSFIEIKPIYVWTPTHVKAHYTCCVLSHLINRTLSLRLHQHEGCISREIVTHEKLYKKLTDCQINQIKVEKIGRAHV